MSIKVPTQYSSYQAKVARSRATSEATWVRWSFIAIMLAFLTLFLIVPLVAVFTEGLRKGFDAYLANFTQPFVNCSCKIAYKGNIHLSQTFLDSNCQFGYGFGLSGKDRTPAWIPERQLREYFLPVFQTAIDAGGQTIMIN